MRPTHIILLSVLTALIGCTAPESQPPEEEPRLRSMGELIEKRVSPPYFQLKAGCKLPEMSFDDGWRQLQVIEFLAERNLSEIVLRSEQNDRERGRLGFFEDHTQPESDRIKNTEKLYLRERNLSLIDNRAVSEIADMHCNKGATFGGIVSDVPPNMGSIPLRMQQKTIIHDPRPRIFLPDEPLEPASPEEPRVPIDDTTRYGVIVCFESSERPRTLLIVDGAELRPWLNSKDEGICEPIDWSEFEDNVVEIFIE